jgi:hypothetical protein
MPNAGANGVSECRPAVAPEYGVPQPHYPFASGGGEYAAVGAERHPGDGAGVAFVGLAELATGNNGSIRSHNASSTRGLAMAAD